MRKSALLCELSSSWALLNCTQELTLPHTPRAIAFPSSSVACLAYTLTENVLLSLETMTLSELALPTASSVSVASLGMGMGALSGLGGYMTLGLGAKAKPSVVKINEGEVLIPKDSECVRGFRILPSDETSSCRLRHLCWS
jgi:hypothetical protein